MEGIGDTQTCLLHPVFHVSQLRGALGPADVPQEIPEHLSKDSGWKLSAEAIVRTRKQRRRPKCWSSSKGCQNLKIQGNMNLGQIQMAISRISPGGKALVKDEGNDRTPLRVYTRQRQK